MNRPPTKATSRLWSVTTRLQKTREVEGLVRWNCEQTALTALAKEKEA